MRKSVFLAASLALAMAWARPASADFIEFDFNGTDAGGFMIADVFEWKPGNSMIIEDVNGTTGTILFQANLGTITSPGADFLNDDGAAFTYTAVSSFTVTFTGPDTYTINPGGSFQIYADTTGTQANDLAGTGFTDGIVILSGTALFGGTGSLTPSSGPDVNPNPSTNCAATDDPPLINCLDQKNTNDYLNFYTVNGTGGTNVDVTVTSFDDDFFLNLVLGSTITFTESQNNLPYRQVDPAAQFFNGAIGVLSVCGPGQLGTPAAPCINGTGSHIMAQTDASTTFQIVQVSEVPEPATLALLGVGLLGAVALRRRQNKK